MLTDGELASMRTQLDASLPEVAEVIRPIRVSDGAGGETEAWALVATPDHAGRTSARPCRIAGAGGSEDVVAGRMAASATAMLTLPALTDVTARDRVVVGDREFDVQAVIQGRSHAVSRRVPAVEIT